MRAQRTTIAPRKTQPSPSALRQEREPQDDNRVVETAFHPGEFFSALLKQLYIAQPYVPRNLYVPVDFEDRAELDDLHA